MSNKEYIMELRAQKNSDFTLFPVKQLFSMILWFLAIALYLYDWLSINAIRLVIGYGCLLAFTVIVWFVYRPFMRKMYWKKNQIFIDQLETLKEQMQ